MSETTRSERFSYRLKLEDRAELDEAAARAGISSSEAVYLAVKRAVDEGMIGRHRPVITSDREAMAALRDDYSVYLHAADRVLVNTWGFPSEYHRGYLAAGLAGDRSLVSVVAQAAAVPIDTSELLEHFFERYIDQHPGCENWSIDKRDLLWMAVRLGRQVVQDDWVSYCWGQIDRGDAAETWRHFQRICCEMADRGDDWRELFDQVGPDRWVLKEKPRLRPVTRRGCRTMEIGEPDDALAPQQVMSEIEGIISGVRSPKIGSPPVPNTGTGPTVRRNSVGGGDFVP